MDTPCLPVYPRVTFSAVCLNVYLIYVSVSVCLVFHLVNPTSNFVETVMKYPDKKHELGLYSQIKVGMLFEPEN
jgi:hypothetical protein